MGWVWWWRWWLNGSDVNKYGVGDDGGRSCGGDGYCKRKMKEERREKRGNHPFKFSSVKRMLGQCHFFVFYSYAFHGLSKSGVWSLCYIKFVSLDLKGCATCEHTPSVKSSSEIHNPISTLGMCHLALWSSFSISFTWNPSHFEDFDLPPPHAHVGDLNVAVQESFPINKKYSCFLILDNVLSLLLNLTPPKFW